jgi:hypothetical protein
VGESWWKTTASGGRLILKNHILSTYFVETDHWRRLYRGDIDVVYGPKGSGKSALYSLLLSKGSELFDRNILLIGAENPRGATAFRDLVTDPPASEREFIGLWKLYIVSLVHGALAEYGVKNDSTRQLEEALAREGLVRGTSSLAGLLRVVVDYARRALRPQALEGGIDIDPITLLPKGFKGKIIFSEPGGQPSDPELKSVDRLLELANAALSMAKYQAWVLLDLRRSSEMTQYCSVEVTLTRNSIQKLICESRRCWRSSLRHRGVLGFHPWGSRNGGPWM